ncbi:dihydroxyacetone kinase family protein [Granulicoccus sp. GXG6511]|uniref:dihydroxyacetone kinase family protein n=1 Tax=Granulicoccus sp. GXG6511 TaxID=3381351 RepID=UPI003D7EF0E8
MVEWIMGNRQFLTSSSEAIELGIAGYAAAHPGAVHLHPDPRFLMRRHPKEEGKVALLSGGGSGHEPLHGGFVGPGLLDAAVPGEVFSSPSSTQVVAATLTVDRGAGVLHIVKNYTGDVINFGLAAEQCRDEGVEVATVLVDDDVPSAERGTKPGRRGTVATLVVEKICGAAAEEGMALADLKVLGDRVVDHARSVGAAVQAGSAFGDDKDAFELAGDEIEFGVGIHGERGTDQLTDLDLEGLVHRMVDEIANDLDGFPELPHLVIVNGLGATTPLELYAAYGLLAERLEREGVAVHDVVVGDLVTSLDMRGLSVTLVALDEEMARLWDAPAQAPGWPTTGWPAASRGPEGADTDPPLPVVEPDPEGHDASLGDDAHAFLAAWVDRFATEGQERAEELGELDRAAGDGDFGTNLATALSRAAGAADRGNPLLGLSDAFASIGGTSGALFALWFRALGRAYAEQPDADGIAKGLRDGVDAVMRLGSAEPGQATMVDAMAPAADAAPGDDLGAHLRSAADAAQAGADSTVGMIASRGRASYVGERGRDISDPGALAVALFLRCGAEAAG